MTEIAKKKCKSIIVRFTTFRHRTLFYRARKNLKSAKVKLDLMKSRFDLLKRANNHMKEIRAINFCHADRNCRLGESFRMKNKIISSTEVKVYLILFIFYFNFTKLSHIQVDIY